jgi:hypothetical protein
MTGSAKQSIAPQKRKNGLLRRFAPRNDEKTYHSPEVGLRTPDISTTMG